MIPEKKLELHLKLGRKLASFVKIGSYFESRTFDWIQLEKSDGNYKAILIRSFDEGDDYAFDVSEFGTVNDIDDLEINFKEGDLNLVLNWIANNYNLEKDGFYQLNDLNNKYRELVLENKLGH